MVTQSIEIMEGTVKDNLTFYDDSYPMPALLKS